MIVVLIIAVVRYGRPVYAPESIVKIDQKLTKLQVILWRENA